MNDKPEHENSMEDKINKVINSAIISGNNVEFNKIVNRINKKKVEDSMKNINNFNKIRFFKKISAACIAILVFSAILYAPFRLNKFNEFINMITNENKEILLPVKDNTMLKSMLKTNNSGVDMIIGKDGAMENGAPQAPVSGEKSNSGSGNLVATSDSSSYSRTNVQVAGVDEADIVKTDGNFIYYISNRTLFVVDVSSTPNMTIKTQISFLSNEQPIEMYVDNNTLTILCYNYNNNYNGTKIVVYDISDKANINVKKEFTCDGYYTTSRKIGDYVYFIGNKYVYSTAETDVDTILPKYTDAGDKVVVQASDIRYFPDDNGPSSFFYIAAINTADANKPAVFKSYIGNAYNVYSSQTALYLTGSKYSNNSTETSIYKFSIDANNIACVASSTAPGYTINQFSMDEYDGYFRIATNNNQSNNIYVFDGKLKRVGSLEGLAKGENIYSVRYIGKKVYMVTYKTVDPLFVIDLSNPTKPSVLGELKIPGYSTYLHPYDETHIIGFGMDTTDVGNNRAITGGLKIAMFDVSDVNNPKELFKTVIGERGTYSDLLNNHKALLFSKEKNIIGFPVSINTQVQKGDTYEYTSYQGYNLYDISFEKGFVLKGSVKHYEQKTVYSTNGSVPPEKGTVTGSGSVSDPGKIAETKPAINYNEATSNSVAPVAPDINPTKPADSNGSVTAIAPSAGSASASTGSATSPSATAPASMPIYGYGGTVLRGIYVGDILYTFSQGKIIASNLNDLSFINELALYSKDSYVNDGYVKDAYVK